MAKITPDDKMGCSLIHRGNKVDLQGSCGIPMLHLHEDLHPVQRGGAGARDGAGHRPGRQLLPPDPRGLLLLCELVRDGQTVAYVQHLVRRERHTLQLRGSWGDWVRYHKMALLPKRHKTQRMASKAYKYDKSYLGLFYCFLYFFYMNSIE